MSRRQHGPALRIERLPLASCSNCDGRGFVQGVFHQMDCVACNGSGLVAADSGAALSAEVLVQQLRLRLSASQEALARMSEVVRRHGLMGPSGDYHGDGRGGPGHRTLD